jgi:hypothetical protein
MVTSVQSELRTTTGVEVGVIGGIGVNVMVGSVVNEDSSDVGSKRVAVGVCEGRFEFKSDVLHDVRGRNNNASRIEKLQRIRINADRLVWIVSPIPRLQIKNKVSPRNFSSSPFDRYFSMIYPEV